MKDITFLTGMALAGLLGNSEIARGLLNHKNGGDKGNQMWFADTAYLMASEALQRIKQGDAQ